MQYVTKRNGELEKFDINKVLQWELWACSDIKAHINWREIILAVKARFFDKMSTQEIQLQLIEECNAKKTWLHSIVAGRLYSAYISKKIYGYPYPRVKEQHQRMVQLGLMVELGYTDEEYEQIEQLIDHSRDYQMAYLQVFQLVNKYGLTDRVNRTLYETPQFVFMRMAMALAADEPNRLQHVAKFYEYLSRFKISAPTPNYVNLGTPLNGFISCCLYTSDDSAQSLAIGDHIAYSMTYMSAGIGGFINTRSKGDGVRQGLIRHQGKLPYFKSVAGAVTANMQSSRGGAATQYFSCYDPEALDIVFLQNPRTPLAKQNRDIHFAMQVNHFFVEKVYKDEEIFTFNVKSEPALMAAFTSGNDALFRKLYAEREADKSVKRHYVRARELALNALRQSHEVATLYYINLDATNDHTPFKDPIQQSNLCVSPDTLLLTREYGYRPIGEMEDKPVHVWNGEEWSPTIVAKTGVNQSLLCVRVSADEHLFCTSYHKWYVRQGSDVVVKRTYELQVGDQLETFNLPYRTDEDSADMNWSEDGVRQELVVLEVFDAGRVDDTYCVRESRRGRAVFNGILTGNCTEITQPTVAYESMQDLYSSEDHGRGEISLCGLAGIIPSNVSDEEYADVAYYALLMIDKCIHKNEYVFPHLEVTAKSRMNAGVGLIGIAYDLAKAGHRFDSKEGLQMAHYIAERHAYHLIKASIKLGRERGNAAWMHKTRWPEGWLPVDTYNENVDEGMDFIYHFDWEELRGELIANKGMRFSALCSHMPTESSSKVSGLPNGIYPVRELYLLKSDGTLAADFIAKDSDTIGGQYQLAWELSPKSLFHYYGVIQKFTDQASSADVYSDRRTSPSLPASRLLDEFFYQYKYGVKSRYYTNSKTTKGLQLESVGGAGCSGGGCTL